MKIDRVPVALTVVNLGLLVLLLAAGAQRALADGAPGMLRGSGLEIVDAAGRVRASISVMPAGTSAKGDAYPETVLLRLITERGRPSVKISATEEAAGLCFAGPTGTENTWLILESKGTTSSLKLENEDGKEQVIKP